jgi:hypothetical protein
VLNVLADFGVARGWPTIGTYLLLLFSRLVLKKREEQRLEAAQMKFLRHLLGITKLDKEKNQSIKEKLGVENIAKEIQQYQQNGYNTYKGWTQIAYQNKHYNIDQKDEGT